jgi:Zn-dependent protease
VEGILGGLEQWLAFSLNDLPYIAAVLLIAFTVHEFAHAAVAYAFGDDTAKEEGRLTLNPAKHLDPFGTLLLFLAGFGWARPVPVNRFKLKRPRLGSILVSLAGPMSNFLLAVLGFLLLYTFASFSWGWQMPVWMTHFIDWFIWLNLVLFVFNLLPLPPLDGYRIIEDIMPTHIRVKMVEWEQYGILIFLILIITPLQAYTIDPIFNVVLRGLVQGLQTIFFHLFA